MSHRSSEISKPILCYVTDRHALGVDDRAGVPTLVAKIRELAQAGVDWVQLREKDLSGRAYAELTKRAVEISRVQQREGHAVRILVNDRLDVALAESAGGVHLGESSMAVKDAKRLAPEGFLIGASVHSLERAKRAEEEGADYLIFGPVFATPSKTGLGEPQGLKPLKEVCHAVGIPVLAIGGVSVQNASKCMVAGPAGLAAIRLFQGAKSPEYVIEELRKKMPQREGNTPAVD